MSELVGEVFFGFHQCENWVHCQKVRLRKVQFSDDFLGVLIFSGVPVVREFARNTGPHHLA